jgi:hypothetical protein
MHFEKIFWEILLEKCVLSQNKSFTYSDCGHEYVRGLFELIHNILKNWKYDVHFKTA